MANRVKEDEKNERIIRNLLKLPENRRCINCNSLGPQYVCTNFWTFICTTCSGIHREFTHRVKSVSMAKFTSQEVSALEGGGNAHAKKLYFKEWDSQRHPLPDSSNVDRLRDFIKHVYVDKRYNGERSLDKPPRVKMGDKEDSYENRRMDVNQVGSRSPPYEDAYDRRYNERASPGGKSDYEEMRSPGYEQENRQYGDYRSSPVHSEVVNDWRRDDGFGRRPEGRKISDGDSRLEGRSPDHQKDAEISSPPVARPVRDILGESVSLRVIEPPKVNSGKIAYGSVQTQRTASSGSLGSTNGNLAESKGENLIDFDADPEPPVTAAVPQSRQTTVIQPISKPVSSSSDENWASFDIPTESKVSQAPAPVNTMESVLSQLSVPASLPGQIPGIPISGGAPANASIVNTPAIPVRGDSPVASLGQLLMPTFSRNAPAAAPANIFSAFPVAGAQTVTPGSTQQLPHGGGNSFVKVNDVGQWLNMQHQQHSLFPAAGNQTQQFTTSVRGAFSNQPSSLGSNTQGLLSNPAFQVPQPVSQLVQDTHSVVVSQPPAVEVRSDGRKALPEDLFAATYPSIPVPVPGWQTGPPRGMGFTMQYNTAVQGMPTFTVSSRSTNPFDINSEPPPVQAAAFHSMASLQGALPIMSPSTSLLRTSSVGSPMTWMPPQSSPYTSAGPFQVPSSQPSVPFASSYASAVPPRAYFSQQIPGNLPPARLQELGNFGSEGPTFSLLNSNQQLVGKYSAPATPNPLPSAGGNPFV